MGTNDSAGAGGGRELRFVVERYGTVDSTMTVAHERALAGASDGTVIVADAQTAGRGRRGRSWSSPKEAGLWLTAIMRPTVPTQGNRSLCLLSLVVGAAVLRAVRALGVKEAMLKWPNDVVVGDRKLSGILLESEAIQGTEPLILAGIGLNVWSRERLVGSLSDIPSDIAEKYIGLCDVVGDGRLALDTILSVVVEHLEVAYDEWMAVGPSPALAYWQAADALLGSMVRAEWPAGSVVGEACGIAADGALRLLVDGYVTPIAAGEVVRVRPVDDEGKTDV